MSGVLRQTRAWFALAVCALALALAACAGRGAPRRIVKIALVAPFEGRARQVGYDAFPALRLAIRAAAAQQPSSGIAIGFIAYNDDGDPARAARVARSVALDPDVVVVIGHLELSTTLAAMAVYTQAGLPLIVPHIAPERLPADPLVFRLAPSAARLGDGQDAPELRDSPAARQALAAFTELSLGPPPAARSIVAYDATQLAIAAIRAEIAASGDSTRAGVAAQLRAARHAGLLGTIAFDARNTWAEAPVFPRATATAGE